MKIKNSEYLRELIKLIEQLYCAYRPGLNIPSEDLSETFCRAMMHKACIIHQQNVTEARWQELNKDLRFLTVKIFERKLNLIVALSKQNRSLIQKNLINGEIQREYYQNLDVIKNTLKLLSLEITLPDIAELRKVVDSFNFLLRFYDKITGFFNQNLDSVSSPDTKEKFKSWLWEQWYNVRKINFKREHLFIIAPILTIVALFFSNFHELFMSTGFGLTIYLLLSVLSAYLIAPFVYRRPYLRMSSALLGFFFVYVSFPYLDIDLKFENRFLKIALDYLQNPDASTAFLIMIGVLALGGYDIYLNRDKEPKN